MTITCDCIFCKLVQQGWTLIDPAGSAWDVLPEQGGIPQAAASDHAGTLARDGEGFESPAPCSGSTALYVAPLNEYVSHLERCCAEALKAINEARAATPDLFTDPHITDSRSWLCMAVDAIAATGDGAAS